MKRLIAGVLCAALVATAPGLLPYAAAAEIVNAPAGAQVRPVQIGTSQLNVLKGSGSLPVAPGALGLDPTQRSIPSVPQLPAPAVSPAHLSQPGAAMIEPGMGEVRLDPAAPLAKAVAPRLEAIAKPGASSETSAKSGDEITTLLQGGSAPSVSDAVAEPADGSGTQGLSPSAPHAVGQQRPPAPPADAPQKKRGLAPKLLAFTVSALRVAAAAGLVVGLNALGVASLPAVFAAVPVAAVWAVSSGVLLLPAALYTRHRLSKHDSPALKKVKLVLDAAIGAYLGAAVIAAPAFSIALATQIAFSSLSLGAATSALTFLAMTGGGKALDVLTTGGVLAALPLLLGLGGAGTIAVGPLLGMMALPVMTTLSFFLGAIVRSAETGRPFSVPGTLQKIRFPAFNWVMTGVVFALTSGYGAVLTTAAFIAWTLLGDKGNEDKKNFDSGRPFWQLAAIALSVSVLGSRWAEKLYRFAQRIADTKAFKFVKKVLGWVLNFNVLYGAVLIYAAATGFSSPLTFLALAFAPERAAHWTERLLRKLFPGGKPAASASAGAATEPESFADGLSRKLPRVHHWARTAALLAVMLAAGFALGAGVFGFAALFKNLLVAAALAVPQLVFSRWLVKKLMKAEPATPENMPRHYAVYAEVVDGVKNLVNAGRASKGQKPIPEPEKVRVPYAGPNAFATGPGPFHATIGVTDGLLDMLLDPTNAREGLLRLVQSVAGDPSGKPFRIFRKAIAGAVPGLPEGASPNEVSQALLRASDEQVQALGKRMLRGVLGHEFSHVTDRHMLTGAIAGAISSGVAFASYGVLWGVGRVKAAAGKVFGGTKPAESAAPGARAAVLSIESAKAHGAEAETLVPAAAGAAIRSLPALLRVFAALWGPTILQIVQMAGSRNNESQADRDGALLIDDPEALALALGMLTTWRPKPGFAFEWSRMPRLAALSQFMTVDPIAQLGQAGVLPKDDALPAWASDRRDDWMFNLWVTHPDTKGRIETLHDIAQSLHKVGAQDFRPQPPPTDGPKLLSAVPAAAPEGVFAKNWRKLREFIRVLPDKSRNREFWKFVWSQALISLGINFHYTALPKIVDPKNDQPQRVLYNRAVNSGSQLVSSLATGGMVDRYSVQNILVWTHLGRSLMLLAVPLLFHFGLLSFIAFQLIIFATGFLQSTSQTAGSVAFNRILAEDTTHYNKANAVFNLVVSVVGIVGPLMAGSFIVLMDAHFGFLSGNALAYGVYGALLGGAVLFFRKLRIPRDELLQARRDLWASLKPKRTFWKAILGLFLAANAAAGPVIKGVTAARVDNKPVLLVEIKGEVSQVTGVPAEFAGYPVKVVPARSVWKELAEGFRLIWSNRFLKIYLLFSTVTALMADPIVFSAIPRYIDGVLHVAPAQQGGVFGLYMAATGLGTGIASFLMMLFRDRHESALEAALAGARKKLGEAGGLDEEKTDAALEAVRSAKAAVLARYREAWRADPDRRISALEFQTDLVEEAAARINARLFAGAKSRPELVKLMADSGLGASLWTWAERHFDAVMKDARRQAKSGLTAMERQGRWSSWLNGVGWLLYWGVFFLPVMHWSLAAIVVASMLQAPAMAIWSALVQHVLGTRFPENMGKIYASINFYTLVFGILGPIIFSPLVRSLPLTWVLAIAAAALSVTAVFDFLQPGKSFPLEKGPGHGPKE
ncbi:MAG: MFS transporter [Elusimicrobia bacterium]|nr:MFS transporter [Elusimicrobiota bacterium]